METVNELLAMKSLLPGRAARPPFHSGNQGSRPRPSSGVLLGGNSAIGHPMPLEDQAQNATNILPVRRNSLREPLSCAQCRTPMKLTDANLAWAGVPRACPCARDDRGADGSL
jgi:hypothetical protein